MKDARSAGRDEGARFFGWVTDLVRAHRARLVRVARREGLRGEDAVDCVQDAFHSFLVLPTARVLVEAPEDSAKILTALARNHARNRRRRHDRARPHDADDATLSALPGASPPADQVIADAERHALMVGCMATLGAMQRAVVDLRLVDDVPGEDVARMLGTTPGNVAVMLHRAKLKLRSCMTPGGDGPPAARGGRRERDDARRRA
jgi:RNA polymerase sigma-70 factor (ECF subfamily)